MFGPEPTELIRQYGMRMELPADTLLYDTRNQESWEYTHYLESGCIALAGITRRGEERVFAYCDEPRIVSFLHLMPIYHGNRASDEPLTMFTATKTKCVVYRIYKREFLELLNTNAEFQAYVTRLLSEYYRNLLHHFHVFQGECATVRLCDLLLDRARETPDGLEMPSFFNYGELSRYLGIHVVTVSRIMVQLKQRGLIQKRGHRIIISDAEGLEEIIRSQSNFDF